MNVSRLFPGFGTNTYLRFCFPSTSALPVPKSSTDRQRTSEKPKNILEYVIVHEMAHIIEPTHSDRFIAILGEHYPTWREARAELNDLPLAAKTWKE